MYNKSHNIIVIWMQKNTEFKIESIVLFSFYKYTQAIVTTVWKVVVFKSVDSH